MVTKDDKALADEIKKAFPKEEAEARQKMLAELEPTLLALSAEAVERALEWPIEVALAAKKLSTAGAGKGWPETDLVRLRALADVVYEAQFRVQMAAAPDNLHPDLVVHSEMRLRHLRDTVTELVRAGTLPWADVPRGTGPTLHDECRRALLILELLRARGIKSGVDIAKTKADAMSLLRDAKERASTIRATDLRDRAYTMLLGAIAKARANAPAGTSIGTMSIIEAATGT